MQKDGGQMSEYDPTEEDNNDEEDMANSKGLLTAALATKAPGHDAEARGDNVGIGRRIGRVSELSFLALFVPSQNGSRRDYQRR